MNTSNNGYNRDKEALPQLNLVLLFGQKGRLPVYFQRLPGNISDVSTLSNVIRTFKALEVPKIHYILDRGFYSLANINALLDSGNKFLVSVPLQNRWVQRAIDDVQDRIHGPEGYQTLDGEALYVHSRLYPWGEKRYRCYLHLFYNAHARAQATDRFNGDLLAYKAELESGKPVSAHQEAYDRFFIITQTPKRGRKVRYQTEAVSQYLSRYTGFQALLSNGLKDPLEAIRVYRDKDVVEKSFDDLKNQLDMKRLRMHHSATMDGKLFSNQHGRAAHPQR